MLSNLQLPPTGPPLLQIHPAGRPLRRGRPSPGQNGSPAASHRPHLPPAARRNLPRRGRRRGRLGCTQPRLPPAATDLTGRPGARHRQQGLRALASIEGDRRRHLRRDAVRWVQERWQGQLPGGLWGAAHDAEAGKVVPDRDRVGGVFVRAGRTAGDLSSGGAYRGLD